jgi:hypothetical protein
MTNPNNNKNFNDEALKINRTLKKENDALSEIVDEFEDFLLNYDIYTTSLKTEENTMIERYATFDRIKDMILKVRSRDGK